MAFKFDPKQPTEVKDWTNFSGSIGKHSIAHFCVVPGDPDEPGALKKHADAVREILRFCFNPAQPLNLRTIGSTWSFSSVIKPGEVVIDPGNMYYISGVPNEHWTAPYRARAAQGFRPIFVEGGTGIGTLNQTLGENGKLALQTSGAGNGHRIAGCIATGTHGSALPIGALHDTVLAMYLIVAPDQAVFVQSGSNPPFLPSVATWLQDQTGIPTRIEASDDAIAAARVGLGSIGFVFGTIVEATDLYCFRIHRVKRNARDPVVLHAIRTLDTSALHPADCPDRPYHFDVVMHPYPPAGKKSWFVTLMWKRSAANMPFKAPLQGIPRTTVDTMGLIGDLTDKLGHGFSAAPVFSVLRDTISGQLYQDANPADDLLFPGQVFGPTTLPKGHGASTEIVVDHKHALAAIDTVYEVLNAQAAPGIGHLLLGCVAVRFVPKTRSLLGMNQFDMNCFIELPSIHSDSVLAIYEELWKKLDEKNIHFTCHWGQRGGFSPARTQRYFGAHAVTWRAARRSLLGNDEIAMRVFASKILHEAGLDG